LRREGQAIRQEGHYIDRNQKGGIAKKSQSCSQDVQTSAGAHFSLTSFFPNLSDFSIQALQNLCKHSITAVQFRMIPRQTGQVSSAFKERIGIVAVRAPFDRITCRMGRRFSKISRRSTSVAEDVGTFAAAGVAGAAAAAEGDAAGRGEGGGAIGFEGAAAAPGAGDAEAGLGSGVDAGMPNESSKEAAETT
jgi:hypothetical protein